MLALAVALVALAVKPATLARTATPTIRQPASPEAEPGPGLLYGRVTTDSAVLEGRLRWGGDQEALWGNYFNGAKSRHPWRVYVPEDLLPQMRDTFSVFGIEIFGWNRQIDLSRPLMARFGDISRLDRYGKEWRITLKSGAVDHISWAGADDMGDGVRVWDRERGVFTLVESTIRTIELFAGPAQGQSMRPIYGTVRTRQGDFTGLVQWNRRECLLSDTLNGLTAGGKAIVPFGDIRSIARHSDDSAMVTRVDGTSVVLSGPRVVGGDDSGRIYVDDPRYGRVLISWSAFERADFVPGDAGPAYSAFAPGGPLTGTVLTRSGRRLAGRLVYDLDESETTETLDAPSNGVDYTITFDRVSSIVVPGPTDAGNNRVTVVLRSGEALQLERSGDLGGWNAGILVFAAGSQRPEYVAWTDVREIRFADTLVPSGL
jgi:hypothetical protein